MPYMPSFGIQRNLRRFHEVLANSVVGEAAAGLEDTDAVALLGEPQRGDAAPEPRADDQNVIVRLHRTQYELTDQ